MIYEEVERTQLNLERFPHHREEGSLSKHTNGSSHDMWTRSTFLCHDSSSTLALHTWYDAHMLPEGATQRRILEVQVGFRCGTEVQCYRASLWVRRCMQGACEASQPLSSCSPNGQGPTLTKLPAVGGPMSSGERFRGETVA